MCGTHLPAMPSLTASCAAATLPGRLRLPTAVHRCRRGSGRTHLVCRAVEGRSVEAPAQEAGASSGSALPEGEGVSCYGHGGREVECVVGDLAAAGPSSSRPVQSTGAARAVTVARCE